MIWLLQSRWWHQSVIIIIMLHWVPTRPCKCELASPESHLRSAWSLDTKHNFAWNQPFVEDRIWTWLTKHTSSIREGLLSVGLLGFSSQASTTSSEKLYVFAFKKISITFNCVLSVISIIMIVNLPQYTGLSGLFPNPWEILCSDVWWRDHKKEVFLVKKKSHIYTWNMGSLCLMVQSQKRNVFGEKKSDLESIVSISSCPYISLVQTHSWYYFWARKKQASC